MTDLNRSLRLPVDPYLYNSTAHWLDQDRLEIKANSPRLDHPEYPEFYKRYQDWMRDQGVVIRDDRTVTPDNTGIDFVDTESMTLFVLRWG